MHMPENDEVRDGRHLMNGTRWVTAEPGDEAPENCVGQRVALPDLTTRAHARVTGGVMDDTLRVPLLRGFTRADYERAFPMGRLINDMDDTVRLPPLPNRWWMA